MKDNMSGNSGDSKRAIQKAAEKRLFGKFDVICGTGEFSYVVNTDFFCQQRVGDMTCYAFRPEN